MTDWYGDLTGEKPAGGKPAPQASPGWYEDLMGMTGKPVQELRQGPLERMREMPLGDSAAAGASPLAAGIASLAPDIEGQIKLLSQRMKIPENRFGVLEGNIVYQDDKGQLQRAIPSVFKGGVVETLSRIAPWMASQFGPSLPQVAGGAAGIATAPVSGPGSVAAAGGAAGLTDIARQALANYLIEQGETKPNRDIDWYNVAGQAGMAGAGQGVSLAASRLLQRNPMGVETYDRAAAMDPARRAQAAGLEAEARGRGIDLSAGQATGLRSLRAQERQLGRFPETMDRVTDFVERQQRQQVPAAVSREIAALSPQRGEAAINQFREGAETVVQNALTGRNAKAKILYERALDQRTDRFWTEEIDTLMQRPSVQRGLSYAKLIAREEGKDITVPVFDKGKLVGRDVVPDWRSWDYIKRGIDRVIEQNTDEFGKVNAYGRVVVQTKDALLKILDTANPDYKVARAAYGNLSDTIEGVLEGGAGMLRSMDGEARRSMLDKIFSGGKTALMPEQVARMRNQFMTAGKLDDWNAGAAYWLADALDQSTNVRVANIAQDFTRRVWGTESQREVMKAALGNNSDRLASFEKLMEVLDAARKVLPEGSPTATDVGALGSAVGTGARLAGKAASPQTYLNLGNELVEGVNALRAPEARIKLAEALLSGNYAKELSQLRLLTPNHERALAITGQILVRSGVVGAGAATGLSQPADRPIPALGGGM